MKWLNLTHGLQIRLVNGTPEHTSPVNMPPVSRDEAIERVEAWLATQEDSSSAEYKKAEAWLEAAKKQQLIDAAAQAIMEAYEACDRPISRDRAVEIVLDGLAKSSDRYAG